MAIIQIPVRNDLPSYSFQMALDDRIYTLSFRFNTRANLWMMDIADESRNPIFSGIPLLQNVFLIDDFPSPIKPQGTFIVFDESGKNRDPDQESLGVDIKLFYDEAI